MRVMMLPSCGKFVQALLRNKSQYFHVLLVLCCLLIYSVFKILHCVSVSNLWLGDKMVCIIIFLLPFSCIGVIKASEQT